MANQVLLTNIEHKDLRVITTAGAQYGDNVWTAITFPAEFRNLQAHFPLVFSKNPDGTSFDALALLGLQDGENLFLGENGWDIGDIPLSIQRQPFLIGVSGENLMVHIDLDNPRVSRTEGEALFLEHGGHTEFLDQMNSRLMAIHQGLQSMKPFVDTLIEYKLLEGFTLDVELNDGTQGRLAGFYTINEERMAALDAAQLELLHKRGYLQAIYMVIASLSNFRNLIERKNRRHAA
jgi:hypothetical protein